MIWEKKEINGDDVKKLMNKYAIDAILASILVRRDILTPEEISYYLENDIRFMHNPFLMDNMEEAVDRINLAIENNEKILAFGDRDVDGITSTVMLVETLKELGADIQWQLPVGDENYGLTEDVILKTEQAGVKLLITLDCGISNIKEIELANSKDIDTIIVDHHNPHEQVPDALVIINPKLVDSGYPFNQLCGCAVTCKLIWAIHFSRTKYYDNPIHIMNIRPANESYVVEVIKLVNLVELDKLIDNIIPGMVKFANSRLKEFIDDNDIFVFDKETQEKLFQKVFGDPSVVQMIDLAPPIVKTFPPLSGKSLLKIKEISKIAKYVSQPISEIDMLKNLVISYIYKSETRLTSNILDKMGYVALGTLADIMPLVNENRIFVKIGLEVLSKCKNAGLRQLLLKQELYGKKIGSKDIGWNISPIINASGRMGEPDKAAKLLLSNDQAEIESLVDYITDLNKQRKNLGDKVWTSILPKAKSSLEKTRKKIIMVAEKSIHRGVTGIIAAKLVKTFKVPSIIVALLHDKAIGSMRSTPDFNAKDFLNHFSDILLDYGGHDMAAGFSLALEDVNRFTDKFYKVAENLEVNPDQVEKIIIDAEIPLAYLTLDLWKIIELMEPYGECNRPLCFLSKGVKIINIDLIGKQDLEHVRMLIDTGKTKWPAMMWNASSRVEVDFRLNDTVDIVYQINKNIYQNIETLRLTIIDIKRQN